MRNTRVSFIFIFVIQFVFVFSSFACKKISTKKIEGTVKIDGILDEEIWQHADIAKNFTQRRPFPGKRPSQATEVRIVYNDYSVFVAAELYDISADSIMKQLSARDEIGFTDRFAIFFDTYHDGINAFQFGVTAGGVQYDYRVSSNGWDRNWDAAWFSAVKIMDDRWVVEMEIPFSALRFPSDEIQNWGLNIERFIARKSELSYWEEIKPQVNGFVNQFGVMDGITDVKPPLRLAVIPYFSTYYKHVNDKPNQATYSSFSVRGGMDIKYGINDAFTLDMMLIPDFGQVVSDNRVLNLSPFEIYNSENRQFFQEGTELFDKGNYLYTRRIGGKPLKFDDVESQLKDGETIIASPLESKIINATKVTGRTNKGLGIGVLNATTAKTFATIEDEEGDQREFQTSPVVNYNILVFDQSLKNNSYVTILNHNVTRGDDYHNSNLIGTNFKLLDKNTDLMVYGKGAWSYQYGFDESEDVSGYNADVGVRKVSGTFNYGVWNNLKTDQFDTNDLGYMRDNNTNSTGIDFEYNLLEPTQRFLNLEADLSINYRRQFRPGMFKELEFETYLKSKFTNFLETRIWFGFSPIESKDFNEPRTAGRYFVNPSYKNTGINIQTDDRKKIRLRTWINYFTFDDDMPREAISFGIGPDFRINDKLSIDTWFSANLKNNDIGYVAGENDNINFGIRDVQTITNVLSTKYAFNNKMDIFFRMRHYWSNAYYSDFLELTKEGGLAESNYSENHDVSFNAFNVDMVYTWVFSPASEFSIVWKNAIVDERSEIDRDYFHNLNKMINAPVENSISFRVLYYLDYMMLSKGRSNIPT